MLSILISQIKDKGTIKKIILIFYGTLKKSTSIAFTRLHFTYIDTNVCMALQKQIFIVIRGGNEIHGV